MKLERINIPGRRTRCWSSSGTISSLSGTYHINGPLTNNQKFRLPWWSCLFALVNFSSVFLQLPLAVQLSLILAPAFSLKLLIIGVKCYYKICKNDTDKENADMIIINQNFHRRMEDNAVGGDRCGKHGHGVQKVCQGRPPKLWMSRCIAACIEMINQGTPMTNIWMVIKWTLAARLYNDNWGDINENIWQIFVGRTFAALTRTCESGTRSSASSPPSRTWWPGVRRASMTSALIKMVTRMTRMRMMVMMLWMIFPAFELLESFKTTPSENDTGFNLSKPQR